MKPEELAKMARNHAELVGIFYHEMRHRLAGIRHEVEKAERFLEEFLPFLLKEEGIEQGRR